MLFEDETIIRLFPTIRKAWSFKGVQGHINISGRNDQRVLLGTINIRTGHRVIIAEPTMRQENFQTLLKEVRRVYKGRPVCMLLDNATPHQSKGSLALAKKLDVSFIWLPKQCSELNAMDHLWRSVKEQISANYQYDDVQTHATAALNYIRGLTNKKARTKAGILADKFWLKAFL